MKYSEKEYPIKRGSKEWNETHNVDGIHLAENYRTPCDRSGWFQDEYTRDTPFSDKAACREHVVVNRYRQIWRNHLLGASMVLGLCDDPADKLDEFTSLTVYPADNGHFSDGIFDDYKAKLTPAGRTTVAHLTFERLFALMSDSLSAEAIPLLTSWLAYLRTRYFLK